MSRQIFANEKKYIFLTNAEGLQSHGWMCYVILNDVSGYKSGLNGEFEIID